MIFKIVVSLSPISASPLCTTNCSHTKNLIPGVKTFSIGTFNTGTSGHVLLMKMAGDTVK